MGRKETEIRDLFETSPIIAAVKDDMGVDHAVETESPVVFVLYGTICTIADIVQRLKDHGKIAIVQADGIISTKASLVKRAIELGMIAGQRTFLIDSMALETTKKQLAVMRPDFMEIMPGVMPGILKIVRTYTDIPLVAGGLISDKKDIIAAFDAGVDAVSTTREELWGL